MNRSTVRFHISENIDTVLLMHILYVPGGQDFSLQYSNPLHVYCFLISG